MKSSWLIIMAAMCIFTMYPALAQSDKEIKQIIIEQSQAGYPGNCPCPYNTDRAGHRCGGRSAYSRPGGYRPLCYSQDVTDQMVAEYNRQHGAGQTTSADLTE